ncbi:MAG: threonine/serine dehydratase [Candidatus Aminicenantes bacterium]|nr:threonine/serine dehydratase [Candidatus Aminicenantes bacterium]
MNNHDYIKLIDIKKEALEAEKRIREHIRETHVEYSPFLSQSGDCNVYLKLENLQLSGSFKLRGVMNKLLSLAEKERKIGLVTASSGNHGAAFAYALKKLGLKGTIFMPSISNQAKIEGLRYYDTELKFHGTDCVEAEVFARNTAEKNHLQYISPYNDLQIIGGQATIGIELRRQIENINTVLVPVGGGGLISGIAGYLKSIDKNIEIIGCQPENSAVMYESIKAGRIVEMESKPTLSDASAGGIEKGTITLNICKKYVDDFILVTEEEIKEGIKLFIEKHNMLIEGTAALPAASYLKTIEKFKNKNVVLILSGARISLDQLKEVLS